MNTSFSTMDMFDVDKFKKEQFRMERLQVFNWGTFSGIHDIAIAKKGFLFVGPSGAGKSTLLDAFSALLVPPRWLDFNAAAHEADSSGRDRNLITYVRGAWAEQEDNDTGVIAKRYLRSTTTWSALALTYSNNSDRHVTLVQIFWIRGNSNNNNDVKRHFLIFERPFEVSELEIFSQSNFDLRKLKQSFPDVLGWDKFRPYGEYFGRLFGIESDLVLRLLHKTQSAKNLGDLNVFLRDFMLDKPETFAVADRLVNEFDELNAAYQAVVTTRKQIETLAPAREQHDKMLAFKGDQNRLKELKQGINNYCEFRRQDLLQKQIAELHIQSESFTGEITQIESILQNQTAALRDLEMQHHTQGGDRIAQWEIERQHLQKQRDETLRRQDQVREICKKLQWIFPDTPQAFAERVGESRQKIESWQQLTTETRDKLRLLDRKKHEAENEFIITKKEITALRNQPSNISADMLELRREIAAATSIDEAALPFVGELIEVKTEEAQWQGAIERVLHGFALSLLVDERNYASLANYTNQTDLKHRRLVYYRTDFINSTQQRSLAMQSLILKINIKQNDHAEWLQNQLRQRFDYVCVDTLQAFRQSDRAALTKEGLIKHNNTRHEKDDRRTINDRRHWLLGFNNREKLALFEQHAQKIALTITQLTDEINQLTENDKQERDRVLHYQALINLQWDEVDPTPLLTRIDQLDKNIKAVHEKNISLQQLKTSIDKQKTKIQATEKNLVLAKVNLAGTLKESKVLQQKLADLLANPESIALTPLQKNGLDRRFAAITEPIKLDTIDKLGRHVLAQLDKELENFNNQINTCIKIIENRYADFIRTWPAESAGIDASIEATADFMAKLDRLELDGLPAHEHRFFELLQNQSHQNLASLATYLDDARKAIMERMDLVNDSLLHAPFNQTINHCTYLRIDVNDRALPDVMEFKRVLHATLKDAWSNNSDSAETRFINLRNLVNRLADQEPEARRWCNLVLDVRQHVEFIGREIDEQGTQIEIYRSGSGKSGGQRQKLATTCLAAALRYQLGGNEHGAPLYAPVILDEAFAKADNDFTRLAMNIFNSFGFQMIVATPLKAVMTLESFIGGACYVEINDRRVSSILQIQYDDERSALKLPKHILPVVEHEIS